VVLFCSVLATLYLLVLWFLIAWVSGLADSITIECDLGAGIRAGGWFAGTGVVIGACVAGDWISVAATLRDFVRYAWPLAIFAWALDCCRLVRWSESGSPRYSRLPEGSWDRWCPHRCGEWLYAAFVQIRNGLRKLEIGIEVGIMRAAPVARPTGVQRALCEGSLGGALSGPNLRLI
jgi:hypothetical protein